MGKKLETETDPVVLEFTLKRLIEKFGDKTLLTARELAVALDLKDEKAVYTLMSRERKGKGKFQIPVVRSGRSVRFNMVAVAVHLCSADAAA